MIFFDCTKVSKIRLSCGLSRVSEKLRHELTLLAGEDLVEVYWDSRRAGIRRLADRSTVEISAKDIFLTPELFDENERPGFAEFLRQTPARTVAIFHDAIPLRHPDISGAVSVARHPQYMKLLARFSTILTVSEASAVDLAEYWDWLRIGNPPEMHSLQLGADFTKRARVLPSHLPNWAERKQVLLLGTLEPRKNQMIALEVFSFLWKQSFDGELAIVGAVADHGGAEIRQRIKKLVKADFPITYHGEVTDDELVEIYRESRCALLPSLAEGCGLPLLESLWMGVPVIANNLPSLQESASGGGCHLLDCQSADVLGEGLLGIWEDGSFWERLALEVEKRDLPTWEGTAKALYQILEKTS
ncbi:MAG: glycosyltransferase [Opitutales bacterium]|nr:glycosyltransferase [Opitutales bacterium]